MILRFYIFCFVCIVSSCAPAHLHLHKYKKRKYVPVAYANKDADKTLGSLWSESSFNLFENARAHRVGDILTIRVREVDRAQRDARTALQRQSDVQAGVGSFWTAMARLVRQNPGLDPNVLLALSQASDFRGTGNTQRSGSLEAVLPVHIVQSLPNGDFFVEGTKALLLNDEESFLYISGVVRPIDIEPDNSISSNVLADVELEYTGHGNISANEHPGFFQKWIPYIWPF